MGIVEAYCGKEEDVRERREAGKRIVEDVDKVRIPARDRISRNIELVG